MQNIQGKGNILGYEIIIRIRDEKDKVQQKEDRLVRMMLIVDLEFNKFFLRTPIPQVLSGFQKFGYPHFHPPQNPAHGPGHLSPCLQVRVRVHACSYSAELCGTFSVSTPCMEWKFGIRL